MKRMLFNATQAEELRVAIVDGQKLIDLDIESANKEQRKSNIYKGVITRIEPSLEAAFVEYGADRHGFLPFKEVSRSYFQPGLDAGKARIQDALKEGQELIVQVDKDERGNKGAALTTYVSLAGRYLVLMPNNPRGGGVSRRVEGDERSELREVLAELKVPDGMSIIARTAAIGRGAEELEWDLNYLMQLWAAIDSVAQENRAPLLIYQEGSLVIRAIRDYFQPDIGEILIDTEEVFEQARAFMGQVMPANVSRLKYYRDDVPLFSRFQIEHHIESAYSRQVNLPAGGAIVIDHTEALVSVDVNSGRATRGSDIEETAFRTNCEAADEIGRQLRLRDLGGLIVIDFIDMESTKNQREVENRLRDALRHDRARVQMGKISRFGLMELSRQRLRPALAETSYIACPRCTGTGHIRSTESAALHILRILEEEAMKENTGAVHTQVPVDVATFLLNEKRSDIQAIEIRQKVNILIIPNIQLETPAHKIVRLRHDDLNHDDVNQPSYKMAETEEIDAKLPKADAQGAKPRAQAAIRQFSPDQPAPAPREVEVKPEVAAAPAPKAGVLSRFVSWLLGEKALTATTPAAEAEQRPAKPRDSGRGERRDGRRGEPRGRDNRPPRAEPRGEPRGGKPEQRPARDGRRNRSDEKPVVKEEAVVSLDATTPDEASRNDRQERGSRRRDRGPRKDRQEVNAVAEEKPVDTLVVAESQDEGVEPKSAEAEGGNGEERSGRSRRGRRGRRGERKSETTDAVGVTVGAVEAAEVPLTQPETHPAEAVATEIDAPTIDAAPAPAVTVSAEPVAAIDAPVEAPALAAPAEVAVVDAAAVAPVTETVLAEVASEASPAVAESPTRLAPPPEPEIAPPSVAVAAHPSVTADPIDVSSALAGSGLVMIETDSSAPVAQGLQVAPPPAGRRRRPAQVVAKDEPLMQVETGNGPQ